MDWIIKTPILWCGEFGAIRHAPAESRENYMRGAISLLKENGIRYACGTTSARRTKLNRFSLVRRRFAQNFLGANA